MAVFWLTHPGSTVGAGGVAVGDLHSVVIDPSDSNHIFVGGHVAAAETTDGGKSFHAVPGLENGDPMAWSVSTDGRIQVASGHMGLRTSADAGRTWTNLTAKLPYSDVHAVGMDPEHPSNWLAYVVGRGVYATTDAGQTWTSKGNANASLYGPILISPGGQSMTASGPSGIVRSIDGGRTWIRLSPLPATFLAADPSDPRHLYAAGTQLTESLDGGANWRPLAGSLSGARAIAVGGGTTPTLVSVIPAGDTFRLLHSQDGGTTWN
ncbi:MAG: hypothetical protein ABI838_03905 [Chloroflexota bacterium]